MTLVPLCLSDALPQTGACITTLSCLEVMQTPVCMYVCMNTRRRVGSMGSYAHAYGLSRNSAVVWDFVRFIIVGDILGEQLI